ncbi:MAG TPA: four-carbon acid sugar kinase family protein, partial [Candidatus Saccharimonadales bacterium]|nr:four-carbon acid sugar kinase family protein [Candidatus Saccharimonadales bacterium]
GRGAGLVFVLTNSRSLSEHAAVALTRRLVRRVVRASRRTGRAVTFVSRSDSTLRGHFPAEVDALAEAMGAPMAPTLLMPYFGDGGRITLDGVHYLVRDGDPVPVARTEYARDPAFAYDTSELARWVADRAGASRATVPIPLALIRSGGPDAVADVLRRLPDRAIAIADAADDRDAEVVAAAMVDVERDGRAILARTAAGYVRARAGQARRPDLTAGEIPGRRGLGLVVVGSHVPMTTVQLERLLADPPIELALVEVPADAADGSVPERERRRARSAIDRAVAAGITPVVVTPRRVAPPAADDPDGVHRARRFARSLARLVTDPPGPPAWVVAKGGITSSDVATRVLGGRSAMVVGQLLPGVSLWLVHREGRGRIPLVVFPGNVGGPEDLRRAVAMMATRSDPP